MLDLLKSLFLFFFLLSKILLIMAVSEHLSIKETEGFDQKTKVKYIET